MKVKIKFPKLMGLSPTEQVKRCGLDIPPFLRRDFDKHDWARRRIQVMRGLEHQRITSFAPERPDNLTDHDKKVIAELLNGAATVQEWLDKPRQALKRQRLSKFLGTKEPRVPSQRKAKRVGLVDMKVIAADLKISAKEARQTLRDIGLQKGEAGWAFPPSEVEMIKKQIRAALAGEASKGRMVRETTKRLKTKED